MKLIIREEGIRMDTEFFEVVMTEEVEQIKRIAEAVMKKHISND